MKESWSLRSAMNDLRDLRGRRKWIKELIGIPTYVGAALLGLRFVGASIFIGIAVFLCFLMIYHLIYSFVFPGFNTTGRKQKVVLFIVIQCAMWYLVIWVAADYQTFLQD